MNSASLAAPNHVNSVPTITEPVIISVITAEGSLSGVLSGDGLGLLDLLGLNGLGDLCEFMYCCSSYSCLIVW